MSEQHDPLAAEELTGEPESAASPAEIEPVELEAEAEDLVVEDLAVEDLDADDELDDFDEDDLDVDDDEEGVFVPRRRHRFLLMNAVPSWLISLLVHTTILILLGYLVLEAEQKERLVINSNISDVLDEEFVEPLDEPIDEPIEVETVDLNTAVAVESEPVLEVQPIDVADDIEAAPVEIELTDFANRMVPMTDLTKGVSNVSGTGFEGRGAAARSQMMADNGGTKKSDDAVRNALDWIMGHQLPDGGWSFNHSIGPGIRSNKNPGSMAEARNGATAMALLPFLGYGMIPTKEMLKSKDEKTRAWSNCVERGIHFLTYVQPQNGNVKIANGMADYTDKGGRLYSHGLCAITLCEAYGMTHRKDYMPFAQMSLNFIVYAQDPVGGGWRYRPREAGDTSVVGWQVMALKSGHMAYLKVPPGTVKGAYHFLDSVQANSGSSYGYTTPGSRAATNAVGLLCRMYLGWKKDHGALQGGVAVLDKQGPTKNMYYNYYATQIMRHYGGEEWEKWNNKMRDQMVNSQSKVGAEKGSWYIGGDHGAKSGGRLYDTSMATMILEVYYRHMPLFKQDAAEDDFPL
ncbi:MAG: hypothetical protein VB817_06195 [Pirellulaceae bacterium]